jgi:trans-aconitate methyltransferase
MLRTGAMTERAVDWVGWLDRWDRQQSFYMEFRERRFSVMFDVLEALGTPELRVIDLACGPGSLSQRVLRRFPNARTVSVDFDPVLLRIGREALAPLAGRIEWVEADLRDDGWPARLPAGRVDAVLSTTALHWLSREELLRLYQRLPALLKPGGVFLNGDHISYEEDQPTLSRLSGSVGKARRRREVTGTAPEEWDTWWKHLEGEPALREEFDLTWTEVLDH